MLQILFHLPNFSPALPQRQACLFQSSSVCPLVADSCLAALMYGQLGQNPFPSHSCKESWALT